jgi:arylsulfatase A-like enzyme
MNRLVTCFTTVVILALSIDLLIAAEQKKLNVLFIAVDDLRPELGCYGASHIKSPNLDKLAASGMKFNRAYCQQAVCSPSRTSLLTGLRPDSTKVYDLQTHFRRTIPDVVALPQHFKQHGYHTESMGKIYHGGLDDAVSWSVPAWNARPGRAGQSGGASKSPQDLEQQARQNAQARQTAKRGPAWDAPDVADNKLFDGQMAEHAVERLQALSKQDQPFFLAVGFLKPHLPFIAPKKYFDLYDPAQIKLAENPYHPKGSNQYTLTNSGELRAYEGVPKANDPITNDMARQLKHAYYACVSYLDANVGAVLNELDRLGLRENTAVVLWGDHGWKLGEHGEWCKHSNMENDTRVAMLLDAPGYKSGQATDSFAEFVDIYPTLCDLTGLPLPGHLEGTSLVPLLKDPGALVKTAALSQYPRGNVMGYSIRTDRQRFTRWVSRQNSESELAVELYDHQTDPAENVNIAGENPQLVKELTQRLQAGWRGALVK